VTNNASFTDADIALELEERERQELWKKKSKARRAALTLEESKKTKKRRRFELEQRLLGCLISESNEKGDIRAVVEKLSDNYGITWRLFFDNRHKVIWRALESINLLSVEERRKIIEEEIYADPAARGLNMAEREYAATHDDYDLIRGIPGSSADNLFLKTLNDKSSQAVIWLERGLEAANAVNLAGGKLYLREIATIGDKELVMPEILAASIRSEYVRRKYQ